MRNVLLVAILLFSPLLASCVAKSVSSSEEKQLTTISDFAGISKDEIYSRTIEYIARAYNSADAVIQLQDEEKGKIVAKGINYSVGPALDFGIKRPFKYTLLIDIKPEKMRVQYENIQAIKLGGVAGPNMSYQWEFVKQALQEEIGAISKFVTNAESSDNW
jgi:hypothetical protein